MLFRLSAAGVAWLAAVLLFAALLEWSGFSRPHIPPGRDGVSALARTLNQNRPTSRGRYTWSVTRAVSFGRELVVDVDAVNTLDATLIAQHIVGATRSRYDEVLVYVHSVDAGVDRLIRRVGWTEGRGYRASAF